MPAQRARISDSPINVNSSAEFTVEHRAGEFTPPRMYRPTIQLAALSDFPFESSPATLLVGVRGLLGQKALRRSTYRQLSDTFRILVFKSIQNFRESSESLRSLLRNAPVQETADIYRTWLVGAII